MDGFSFWKIQMMWEDFYQPQKGVVGHKEQPNSVLDQMEEQYPRGRYSDINMTPRCYSNELKSKDILCPNCLHQQLRSRQ
jgi:hypothetical protein